MSVRALTNRAAALHADELVRWREAWGAFWRRVAALEPEADAALGDGTAAVLDEADAVLARWAQDLDAELGPDPDV